MQARVNGETDPEQKKIQLKMVTKANGDSYMKFDLIEPVIFVRPHVLKRLSEFAVSGLRMLNTSGKVEQ